MTSSITRHRFAALFISVTIVVFLLYGLLLEKHYALDTYIVETQGKLWLQHIALGRFVSAALLKLCASLGINTATEQSIFTFGAIFSLSSAVSLLVVFFSPLVRNHNNSTFLFLCLACLSSLCNLFVLHWFLFPEVVFIITLGLLLAVTTLFCLRLPGWKSWPASSLLLFLALSCYQAVGAFFVIFALLYFSCLQQKTSLWITVRGYGKTLCIYFMAGLTNIALVRWCGISDERTAFQQTDLFHNAMAILANLQHKLQTTGLGNTPVVVFVFCISVLLFLALLFLRQGRSKRAEIPALPHLFFFAFLRHWNNIWPTSAHQYRRYLAKKHRRTDEFAGGTLSFYLFSGGTREKAGGRYNISTFPFYLLSHQCDNNIPGGTEPPCNKQDGQADCHSHYKGSYPP